MINQVTTHPNKYTHPPFYTTKMWREFVFTRNPDPATGWVALRERDFAARIELAAILFAVMCCALRCRHQPDSDGWSPMIWLSNINADVCR